MKFSTDKGPRRGRRGERGAGSLSFILVIMFLAAAAYAAYQVAPVVYNASLYKVYMQDTVDKAVATGKGEAWVREHLVKGVAEDYDLPTDPRVETRLTDGRIVVRVRWTRAIEFPGYVYEYDFDHTVTSAKFLSS